MRLRLSAAVATLAAVTSTAALGAEQPLEFAQTCMRYETDIDVIADTLTDLGWQRTAGSEVVASGLTWIGVTDYFTTDTGGESLETILELKVKTAEALIRKKDIPQSKGRFLVRGNDVLYVMWRQPTTSVTEIECHAALSADTMQEMTAHLDLKSLPAFHPGPTEKTEAGNVTVSLLNPEKLAPHTPPGAIVKTYHISRNQ